MKNTIKTLIFGITFSATAMATTSDNIVEIGIDRVYAPTQGYDDNDLIQIVVDTELPNSCYRQADAQFQIDQQNSRVIVRQFARQSTEGACAHPEELPPDLRAPIGMASEVRISDLPKGDYTIVFQNSRGVQARPLNVARAPATTIDSLRYATVANAFVNDYIPASQENIEVRLTLVLNSSCSILKDELITSFQDNVLVVLPVVAVTNDFCLPTSRPVYKVFQVENPGPGRHLLHVRSLGGTAAYKFFVVQADK